MTEKEIQRISFESKIFDKYCNYSFPTDIKMESPNNVYGTTELIKMDCLTKDLKTPYTDVKDCIDRENKLKHFEDIEEDLGVDLDVLFKALKNGLYYKILVEYKDVSKMKFPMLRMINNELCLISPKWIKSTWMNVKVKDYGKTWALTKEELEEE